MFTLKFDTSNHAFQEFGMPELEIERVLREVADSVRDGDQRNFIFDANGNNIGEWVFER